MLHVLSVLGPCVRAGAIAAALGAALALQGCLAVTDSLRFEGGMAVPSTVVEIAEPPDGMSEDMGWDSADPCRSADLSAQDWAPLEVAFLGPAEEGNACRIEFEPIPVADLDGDSFELASFSREETPAGRSLLRVSVGGKRAFDGLMDRMFDSTAVREPLCGPEGAEGREECLRKAEGLCAHVREGLPRMADIPGEGAGEAAYEGCLAEFSQPLPAPELTDEQRELAVRQMMSIVDRVPYTVRISGDVAAVGEGWARTAEDAWEWRGTLGGLRHGIIEFAVPLGAPGGGEG